MWAPQVEARTLAGDRPGAEPQELSGGQRPRFESDARPHLRSRRGGGDQLERGAGAQRPGRVRSGGVRARPHQLLDGDAKRLLWIRELRAQVWGKPIRGFDERLEMPSPRRRERIVAGSEPEMRLPCGDTDRADEAGAQVAKRAVAPIERPGERERCTRDISPTDPPERAVSDGGCRHPETRERRQPLQPLSDVPPPQKYAAIRVGSEKPPGLDRPGERETPPCTDDRHSRGA